MTRHLTRRSALSAVAGLLAGGGVVAATSTSASAAVTLEQLSVPDASKEVRGDVTAVRVRCEAGYAYETPEYKPAPELWQLRLYAADTEIATASGRAGGRKDSGTATLEGSLLDSAGFDQSDFADGESVDVPLRVEFEVRGGGSTLAQANQSATGSLTVRQAGYDASLYGVVGGRAEFVVDGSDGE